jgi:hypothetical protein
MKWLLCLLTLACISCSEESEPSPETPTGKVTYLGLISMDVRKVAFISYGDELQSPDKTNDIQQIDVDLYSMKASFKGTLNDFYDIPCSFERDLTLAEYQKIRDTYQKISLCEYSPVETAWYACPATLSKRIHLQSASKYISVQPEDINSCSYNRTNCSASSFYSLEILFRDLFRDDFDQCVN